MAEKKNNASKNEQNLLDIFNGSELAISIPLNKEQSDHLKEMVNYQPGLTYPIQTFFNSFSVENKIEKDNKIAVIPTTFTLIEFDSRKPQLIQPSIRELKVERRSTDPEAWAIVSMGAVLAKDGDWEYEPMPSARDKKFFNRCRWDSAEQAIEFAQKHMRIYPSGYKPEESNKTDQLKI